MKNFNVLKRQIIYRSTHRGTREMDILLGNFVKKYIDEFNDSDLKDLRQLLFIEDEIIYNWYFKNDSNTNVPNTKVSLMLKNFKL